MKKIVLAAFAAMLPLLCSAQSSVVVDRYLDDYQAFVQRVESQKSYTEDEYLALDSIYRDFSSQYHQTYKAQMTNAQLSRYFELRTRYNKKMANRTADKVAVKIDSVGGNVVDGVKKTGSRVSGFLRGVFKKK